MPHVSMSKFVDFLQTTGPARVTEALSHAAPPFDLYAEWKVGALSLLAQGKALGTAEEVFPGLADVKKQRLYAPLLKGLKKFLRSSAGVWFAPPVVDYPLAHGVAVRVNPELGLTISGVPLVVKLHLRTSKLTRERTQLLVALMTQALEGVAPKNAGFAVLDVARGVIHHGGTEAVQKRAREVLRADGLSYGALRGGR